ncbi:MAG: AGE family epimerase/isomerase [Acidobacteria bacterium]|nr:AGE family epimerase/isomerase [Acidobacteriota bacterium]
MKHRRKVMASFLILVISSFCFAQAGIPRPAPSTAPLTYLAPGKENYLRLAAEVDAMLNRDVLEVWFPRCVDNRNGGFYSNFSRQWEPSPSNGKFSVFQARMTWMAAEIAMRHPELKEQYLPIAEHGGAFLKNILWDKQYGGFFWGVNDNGSISNYYTEGKELYGESFAIFGIAAAYQATHDPKALSLAQDAFRWIEEHAHDPKNGGYFEFLTRAGEPVEAGPGSVQAQNVPVGGFFVGYKSMNTHIHLLEALTELYAVWKDPTVRKRLEELLEINRDKISIRPGVMNLFYTNEWHPIPDHDSYGHDVETAYLMLEAEAALGVPHDPRTMRMARLLVDHALAYGWDDKMGGFYEDGTTFGKPENQSKEWWVEMEGLNSLLLMHEQYGRETDTYFKKFQKQWYFIQHYQADSEYHGIYPMVGADGVPITRVKGEIWKAAYHDGRALLNVSERLHRLAGEAERK